MPKRRFYVQGNAKSFCKCGHLGDGAGSAHRNDYGPNLSPGHGACMLPDCPCTKFTWKRFTPEFEASRRPPGGVA
jgi:hypothetical protein